MQKTKPNWAKYLFVHLISLAHLRYIKHYVQQREAGHRIALLWEDKVANKRTYMGKGSEGCQHHTLSIFLFAVAFCKMAFQAPFL